MSAADADAKVEDDNLLVPDRVGDVEIDQPRPPLKRKRTLLLCSALVGVYLCYGVIYSVPPPVYPREAEARGASPSQYGFVFGISHLAAFLAAPCFADLGHRFGSRRVYKYTYVTEGLAGGIFFSFLAYVKSAAAFLWLSYLLRFVYGAAEAACSTAVLGMMTNVFPDKANTIMSLTESIFGLGYAIGPALGSLLYDLGGFQLPFLASGFMSLATGTALFILIPSSPTSNRKDIQSPSGKITVIKLLKMPLAAVALLDNALVAASCGFVEAMLEPHARTKAGMTVQSIGLAFLLSGVVYMVISPAVGHVCDKWSSQVKLTTVSLLGQLILTCGKLTVGPAPFLHVGASEPLILASCAMDGLGMAFSLVSTYARLTAAVASAGVTKNAHMYTVTSGAWYSSFYLGNFLGPTLFGHVVEWAGFSSAATASAVLFLAMAVVNLGVILHQVCGVAKVRYVRMDTKCQNGFAASGSKVRSTFEYLDSE